MFNEYALVGAAIRGHVEIVKHLLALPAERGVTSSAVNSALETAVRCGHIEVVKQLLTLPAERGMNSSAADTAMGLQQGIVVLVKLQSIYGVTCRTRSDFGELLIPPLEVL